MNPWGKETDKGKVNVSLFYFCVSRKCPTEKTKSVVEKNGIRYIKGGYDKTAGESMG
jgi:hypothetical protein